MPCPRAPHTAYDFTANPCSAYRDHCSFDSFPAACAVSMNALHEPFHGTSILRWLSKKCSATAAT